MGTFTERRPRPGPTSMGVRSSRLLRRVRRLLCTTSRLPTAEARGCSRAPTETSMERLGTEAAVAPISVTTVVARCLAFLWGLGHLSALGLVNNRRLRTQVGH